jgi:hypothetical protein
VQYCEKLVVVVESPCVNAVYLQDVLDGLVEVPLYTVQKIVQQYDPEEYELNLESVLVEDKN